jgi:hypothetical protein
MSVNWEQVAPIQSLIGGAFIGASFLLYAYRLDSDSKLKPLNFIIGLLLALLAYKGIQGESAGLIDLNTITSIVVGLLIGLGALITHACYGNYCGIASKFSLTKLAIIFFVLVGVFTALILLRN